MWATGSLFLLPPRDPSAAPSPISIPFSAIALPPVPIEPVLPMSSGPWHSESPPTALPSVVPATAILPFAAAATGPLTQGPSPAPVAGCDVARPCCLRRVPLDEGTEFAIAPLEGGPGAASSYHSVRCRWCRSSRERMTGAAFPASVLTANDFVGVSEMAMLLPSTDLVSGAGGTTSLPPMGGTTKRISRSFSGIADG